MLFANLVDVLGLRLLNDDEAMGGFSVHDPLEPLQLRVDEQRPARSSSHDGAVFNRQHIRLQAFGCPNSLSHGTRVSRFTSCMFLCRLEV